MFRMAIPIVFAMAVALGLIAGVPTRSGAQSEPPTRATPPPPAADEAAEGVTCEDLAWWDADVRPPDPSASSVHPALLTPTVDIGTPAALDDRELYLVVLRLAPGGCIGFDSPGNTKVGAVIWMVGQGKVEFSWKLLEGAVPGGIPIVTRGDEATIDDATPILDIGDEPTAPEILYPGDWVTQDRQVAVAYRNVGDDTAVILKAVLAVPEGGGCSGDCR